MEMKQAVGPLADLIRGHMTDDVRPSEAPAGPDFWGDEEARRAILDVPAHGIVTFPEQLTQALAWPAQDLIPLNRAANTSLNQAGWIVGPIDMSKVYRAMAKVSTGAGTAGCTVVGAWFAGNVSNVSQVGNALAASWTWAQVSGGATINIANSATGTICTSEIRADQLPSNTRYLIFVINNQCAQLFSAEVICAGGAYRPTSQYNCTAILNQAVT